MTEWQLPSAVSIEVSDGMMRDGWIAYDIVGRVVEFGAIGRGVLGPESGATVVAKIVCGVDVWAALIAMGARLKEGVVK